jgi:hypothetical protein
LDEPLASVEDATFGDKADAWDGASPFQGIGATLGASGFRPEWVIHARKMALAARMHSP